MTQFRSITTVDLHLFEGGCACTKLWRACVRWLRSRRHLRSVTSDCRRRIPQENSSLSGEEPHKCLTLTAAPFPLPGLLPSDPAETPAASLMLSAPSRAPKNPAERWRHSLVQMHSIRGGSSRCSMTAAAPAEELPDFAMTSSGVSAASALGHGRRSAIHVPRVRSAVRCCTAPMRPDIPLSGLTVEVHWPVASSQGKVVVGINGDQCLC